MQCVIPGKSVKLFSKMVQCLQKIGEELHMEAQPNQFVLRTLNQSRSAYFCFYLPSTFFEEYGLENGVVENLRFKSLLKPTMAVFKSVSTVEKCSVKFVEDDPKLVFEMHCKLGVKKTYKLNVEDCEAVQAVYDKSACAHELQAKPGVLISAVATFPSAIEDISFGLTKEHVRLKSYIDESKRKTTSSTSKDPNAAKPLLTELTLDSADFDKYQLGSEKTEVVFSLRDLKAVTQFCEAAMQPVSVYIDEPGKPLLFAMEMYNIFRADFVLATLQDHMEPQTDTPSSSQHPAHHQHPHHGSTSTPSRSTPSNLIPQHSGVSGMGASSSRTQSPGQQSPFPYQQGAHYGRASPQITPVPHYLHENNDRNQPGFRRNGMQSENDQMAPMLKKMKVEDGYADQDHQSIPLLPVHNDQDMDDGDVPDSQE